jgi:hypothetical protein
VNRRRQRTLNLLPRKQGPLLQKIGETEIIDELRVIGLPIRARGDKK